MGSLALPSKPLVTVALSDADSSTALKIVESKLHDAGVDLTFDKEQTAYLERVGGRASDLESVSSSSCHKTILPLRRLPNTDYP